MSRRLFITPMSMAGKFMRHMVIAMLRECVRWTHCLYNADGPDNGPIYLTRRLLVRPTRIGIRKCQGYFYAQ